MSGNRRGEAHPSIDVADARIASALVDPAVRSWVKDALISVRTKDPVDAASDAALLAKLLGDRADALLIAHVGRDAVERK